MIATPPLRGHANASTREKRPRTRPGRVRDAHNSSKFHRVGRVRTRFSQLEVALRGLLRTSAEGRPAGEHCGAFEARAGGAGTGCCQQQAG
eukprot:gene20034-biopygen10085